MAKGLNLTDSSIQRLDIVLDADGLDAEIRIYGDLIDDQDDVIKQIEVITKFSLFPANVKAQLNSALRSISQDFSNSEVNENKATWKDI